MNPYNLFRVGISVPKNRLADPISNGKIIAKQAKEAEKQGCGLLVFPALALTGVDCGDLFFQKQLYEKQNQALDYVLEQTRSLHITLVLGFYVKTTSGLWLTSVCLQEGSIKGFLPQNPSAKQSRWFQRSEENRPDTLTFEKREFPLTSCISDGNFIFGAETSAHLVIHQSVEPTLLNSAHLWSQKVTVQSREHKNACLLLHPSTTQSTDNGVSGAQIFLAQQGEMLLSSRDFSREDRLEIIDLDLDAMEFEKSQGSNQKHPWDSKKNPLVALAPLSYVSRAPLYRNYQKRPFIPQNPDLYDQAFLIQSHGLAGRIDHVNSKKTVIGISGGLDSTLALLVCVKAHEILQRPAEDILAITMPGFGTTDTTYENALELMRQLGVTQREISIQKAVSGHFEDISQDPDNHDIAYENAQARERTQILMDVANQYGGLVVGTGDLSEEALGWCTYNGDHMAMYNVNTGVPKTFIQELIGFLAKKKENQKVKEALLRIVNTPISPELLPPDSAGDMVQKTEESIGPYRVHDFFLYHTLYNGMAPKKLLFIAEHTFAGEYKKEELKSWLKIFYRRFFTQQFKRNCAPDGPQVFPIGLSSHGAFILASDAHYEAFMEDLD